MLCLLLNRRRHHREGSPPGTHLIAESTEAMWIKCFAQGHNILMQPGFNRRSL